jgi:hypothetical protein
MFSYYALKECDFLLWDARSGKKMAISNDTTTYYLVALSPEAVVDLLTGTLLNAV